MEAYNMLGAGLSMGAPEPSNSGVSSGTAAASAPSAGARAYAREWLYRLVMFPSYFTPCPGCCVTNKTPKREQLLTLFDTQCPARVLCSHCPEHKDRLPWLLQVRRSAFKDVVKATDISRFGCDTGGIQQYTLNGSKVLYLNREAAPDRKAAPTAAAPATCAVDGRAMMDKGSVYCSLKCKMHGEDPEFAEWLEAQDPSVKEAAYAAATAPPRPTAACKRAAPNGCPYAYGPAASGGSRGGAPGGGGGASPASSGGSGGALGGASSGRPRKAPRVAEGAGPGGGAAAAPRPRVIVVKHHQPATGGYCAGAASSAARAAGVAPPHGHSHFAAPRGAFFAAASHAADGPVLPDEWMCDGPLADLDQALSCSTQWGGALALALAPPPAGACSGAPGLPPAALPAVGDWAPAGACGAASPSSAADADEWWLPATGPAQPAPAPAVPAPAFAPAASAPAFAPAAGAPSPPPAACGDDDLLVEWPAGGGGLGGCGGLYGIEPASPRTAGCGDASFLWA